MSSRQSYARQRASPRFRKVEKMLDKKARLWLRQNASKLEKSASPTRTRSSHPKARILMSKYKAHPTAQYIMTFQEYRDMGKRDAICRSYELPIIRN